MNTDYTTDFLGTRYRIGMCVALASVAMLFTSLSSAYVVRSGVMLDWFPIAIPRVMFGSTALILLSSVSIEIARRKLKQGLSAGYSRYLLLTTALGLGFLVSQVVAWRQLAGQGIYLASNPYSSFFYLLTGAHAVHLAGGLLALGFLWLRSRNKLVRQATADAVSIYWHFMDALWIYLFLLLFLWR
ncbi:MAG TPA: cytochrome c oxidase subunit 3 [Pyrinomonadaceae bacterium]|nr:cytochrome c oxidase subunit 3 [Pyrinomonadaceae bacterium]